MIANGTAIRTAPSTYLWSAVRIAEGLSKYFLMITEL